MKQIIGIIILWVVISMTGFTQTLTPDLVTTSGDFYKTGTGSLSLSIGEPLTETYTTTNNLLTQGFQQSKWTVSPTGINDPKTIDLKVFPNPVTDRLNIEFPSGSGQAFDISLFDINGKLLFKKVGLNATGQIDLSNINESSLILKVYNLNTKTNQSFKIQKIK